MLLPSGNEWDREMEVGCGMNALVYHHSISISKHIRQRQNIRCARHQYKR